MTQQFQVLRCAFCHLFQVQQVKKSKKWNCKVCNEKQSILKVFGQGSGSDCRHHVQKLNLMQGEIQQAPVNMLRKRKKSDLYTTDTQRHEKRNISGFTDDVKRFEEKSYDSVTVSTKCCGDTTCKSMLIPDVEEHMIHRKNKDPCLKASELSKWDKFLLSGKSCTSGATTSMFQKRQETLAEASLAEKNGRADPSVSISSCNYHHASQQNVAIPCEEEEINHIPVGRSKQSPSLPNAQFQQRLLNRLPEKTTSAHSTSIVAVSSSKIPSRSLFSTGEDFDDDI